MNHGCNHFLYCNQCLDELRSAFFAQHSRQTSRACLAATLKRKKKEQDFIELYTCVQIPGKLSLHLPELHAKVFQGEIEGVRGGPSGCLGSHHSSSLCFVVHGEITADLLHGFTWLLKAESI